MSQRNWKVGLLGAGFILKAHAKALKALPEVSLVAVCDLAEEKAREAATAFGIPQVFTSLEQLLASDVEVVHVLLPPQLHGSATRALLESGRHVFLEKPMGLDPVECRELATLADQRKLKLGVNHNFLFLPAYEKLRRDRADGLLGALDQVTVNWLYPLPLIQFGPYNNWMLRQPENLFFELGPHLVAFMADLAGVPDRLSVDAFAPIDLPGGSRVFRRWHVHGDCDGVAVDLNLSVKPGYADRSISIRGHGATARCDFERDVYVRDEPSGHALLFDNYFSLRNVARQIAANGRRNLLSSLAATLRKGPGANPFGTSIANSIRTFYAGLAGTLDRRLSGHFGADVIDICARITSQLDTSVSSLPSDPGRRWQVQTPLQRPTVLVIGGTGFIGRYLVQGLTAQGLGVRVVTRGVGSAQLALAGLPVELAPGDLADPAFMASALAGIEVVYHLAKAAGERWDDYVRHDVAVTRNIAEQALAAGVRRFIYTGTIDSYYSAREGDVITGDTPLDPGIATRNHYARSKATCEALLKEMEKERGLPLVIFRPGVVIGKGCPPAHWGIGMFQSETRVQLWGDGSHKLPLVLVEDVADALLRAHDAAGIEGGTFLLTDVPLLSGREYVDALSRVSGTQVRAEPTPAWRVFLGDLVKETVKHAIRHPNRRVPSYRDWDSRSHRARYDAAKTREVLGWQPAGSREALIERGIVAPVRDFMR
ncbi:MAG: NAD-dependent epimerase/dehydratase family protein [Rhodocyclaceae bacterium]|nr:MAG: NAD-dependent epimerase/dehydratase family protein [Rhodocyclaceae bacterium]